MQVAIDSAKRVFDVDVNNELLRLGNQIGIQQNKYPVFWKNVNPNNFKDEEGNFKSYKINKFLVCPMNYLCDVEIKRFRSCEVTYPMDKFFNKYELDINKKTCKRIEELIEKYSLDVYNASCEDIEYDDYLLLRDDFENLIEDLSKSSISSKYLGLTSWLIDRAFLISPQSKMGAPHQDSNTNKNKSLLLKILYDINPKNVLKCFSKNVKID